MVNVFRIMRLHFISLLLTSWVRVNILIKHTFIVIRSFALAKLQCVSLLAISKDNSELSHLTFASIGPVTKDVKDTYMQHIEDELANYVY